MTILFDDLWSYDNPAATEAKFRELLPGAEAGDDISYHLQLLTQIARAQALQREFNAARATLSGVEEDLEEAPAVVRVRWLLERGRVENSAGDAATAQPFFLEAWEVSREAALDFYAVDAAHMLGIVGPGKASLEWNRKALEIAEASEDPLARRWRASLANNIGWTYFEAGEYEAALEMFEDALALREGQGKENPIRIARWCVAKCQRLLGRVDEALATQRELLAAQEAEGGSDGYVFEEIGECLLAQGKADEAAPWFDRAFQELSQDPWVAESEPERLERMKRLATGQE